MPRLLARDEQVSFTTIAAHGYAAVGNAVDIVAAASPLGSVAAEDWLVTSPNCVDWAVSPMKDFVVGRRGWDNWVVAKAAADPAITVVDATRTVNAVHLSELRLHVDLPLVSDAEEPHRARHAVDDRDEEWNMNAVLAAGARLDGAATIGWETCSMHTEYGDEEEVGSACVRCGCRVLGC